LKLENKTFEEDEEMRTVKIALVTGDGAAPEMMAVACAVAKRAAVLDYVNIEWVETPMGWNALRQYGDTLPEESLRKVLDLGIVFFGGVGDSKIELGLAPEQAYLKPETRCLLRIRKELGLLVNVRPVIINEVLRPLARLKLDELPPGGIRQIWLRLLNQDVYFGNVDLLPLVPPDLARELGLMMKQDVTGTEDRVVEFAYFTKENLEKYFRIALGMARSLGLPAISIHKANIRALFVFWQKIMQRIHDTEFSDVTLTHQLVDSANALLFKPEKLHGVVICSNDHGDTATDGANGIFTLGMMYSSSVNFGTGSALFESGAGTAYDIAGLNIANPFGRIRTAGLMLEHIGAPTGARAIEEIFFGIIRDGWRTRDLVSAGDDPRQILGTKEIGELFLSRLVT
jgi:3-isopropylmalate dehydrogenase